MFERLRAATRAFLAPRRVWTREQIYQHLRASYDAAKTNVGNENHWSNADQLDPHSAADYGVRLKLRSRSRYEAMENNPYLKGVLLTLAADFVGSGPKLQITEPKSRISQDDRLFIEGEFRKWCHQTKIRQKVWRAKIAKIVDGEAFLFPFFNQRLRNNVKLDFFMVEADQVSSQNSLSNFNRSLGDNQVRRGGVSNTQRRKRFPTAPSVENPRHYNEIDGIRFDDNGLPLAYFLLDQHPGGTLHTFRIFYGNEGKWIHADNVIHWFRQDRGWLRGIPELAPSIPLCALLRRYTLAVVKTAETGASVSAVLESQGPPGTAAWTDGDGTVLNDSPFDAFPISHNMFVNLPWGYTMKQLETRQPTDIYDKFVNALLKEICRPLLVPFNMASGSSQDSNMASAIVDQHIYRGGVDSERIHCDEEVMDPIFLHWWNEASRIPGYLPESAKSSNSRRKVPIPNTSLLEEPPEHKWRWPRVGLDHTDPEKVANALQTMREQKFLTDQDIQEKYFNRTQEEWESQIKENDEFRKQLEPELPETDQGFKPPKRLSNGAATNN